MDCNGIKYKNMAFSGDQSISSSRGGSTSGDQDGKRVSILTNHAEALHDCTPSRNQTFLQPGTLGDSYF